MGSSIICTINGYRYLLLYAADMSWQDKNGISLYVDILIHSPAVCYMEKLPKNRPEVARTRTSTYNGTRCKWAVA